MKSSASFFFKTAIISNLILNPIYLTNGTEGDWLTKLSTSSILDSDIRLTALLCLGFVTLTYAYINLITLNRNREMILEITEQTTSIESKFSANTIHVKGIDRNLNYLKIKSIMASLFEKVFPGKVLEITVIPRYSTLLSLYTERHRLESKLCGFKELNEAKNIRISMRLGILGPNVDGVNYIEQELKIIDKIISFYRGLNNKENCGNAFVSFYSKKTVEKLLKNQHVLFQHKRSLEGKLLNLPDWKLSKAASPSNIIWENIKYGRLGRFLKMITNNILFFFLSFVLLSPAHISEGLSWCIKTAGVTNEKLASNILEYVYPLSIVTINAAVIPTVSSLMALWEMHYKRSHREKSIMLKSFSFMFFTTILLPTFGHLDLNSLEKILLDYNDYEKNFFMPFLQNSFFYFRYVIQVSFISNAMQLLALPAFFVKKLFVFLSSNEYELKIAKSMV